MRRKLTQLAKASGLLAKSGLVIAVGAALSACDGESLPLDENGNPQNITIEITIGNSSSAGQSVSTSSASHSRVSSASSQYYSSYSSAAASAVYATSTSSEVSISSLNYSSSWVTSSWVNSSLAFSQGSSVSSTISTPWQSSRSSEISSAWPSSIGSITSSTGFSSSQPALVIYPESPARISLQHSLPTSWGFNIDDIVSDPNSGKAFAIDRELAELYKLDLLTGDIVANEALAADSHGLSLLASEQLLATVSRVEATLTTRNTADLSLIETVELSEIPYDAAIAKNGIVAVSFATGARQIALYDTLANAFLSPLAAPRNSQLTVVGNQLFVYSADEPNTLRSFVLDASGVIVANERMFDQALGSVLAAAEQSSLVFTEQGQLIDRATLELVDTTSYGQTSFKDAAFLPDPRYAISIDESSYVRLFDAQYLPEDHGVSNDPRRVGSVSSLQPIKNQATAVAVYDDTAFVIHEGHWSTSVKYSITQLVLTPYLTDERRLAEVEFATSSFSSSNGNTSGSSVSTVVTSSSIPTAPSSARVSSVPFSSAVSTSIATSSSSSSVAVSSSSVQTSSANSDYLAIALPIRSTSIVEQKWVDRDKGVAYLRINSGGYQHIRALDLRTGFLGDTLGLHSRFPVQALTISPNFDAVWSFTSDGSDGVQGGRLFKQDISGGNALEAVSVDVGHEVSEIIVTQWSVFTLGSARDVIYQHNPNTGAVYYELAVNPVDDWLYLPGSDTLYLKSAGVVAEYGLDGRVIYPTDFTANVGDNRRGFGWVNPSETRLYQSRCNVLELPTFEPLNICANVDDRMQFIDIAFGDADSHYSLESYFDGAGDVYRTALQNYQTTQLPLQGHHIFKTAAGVHVYHFDNGEHKLYQLEGAEPVKASFSTHEPRAEETLVGRVPYAKHFYWDMEFYASFWSNPVLIVDLPSFESSAGAQIVIEPICAIDGCVSGQYIQSLPASSVHSQFIISLESFFTIHDIRYFEGFMVRTDGAFSSDEESPFTLPSNSLLARGNDCSQFGGRFQHVFCAL